MAIDQPSWPILALSQGEKILEFQRWCKKKQEMMNVPNYMDKKVTKQNLWGSCIKLSDGLEIWEKIEEEHGDQNHTREGKKFSK